MGDRVVPRATFIVDEKSMECRIRELVRQDIWDVVGDRVWDGAWGVVWNQVFDPVRDCVSVRIANG